MKPIKEGKVREIYDNGDSLIMVATDRISCFDVILNNQVTKKGTVLTQMSKFWFDMTEDILPNHMISVDVKDMPEFFQQEKFDGNSMMCRKLEMLPIECIVRGYITGSGWASYQKTGKVCGIELPEGLKESDKLPEPIYTPSTKAEIGTFFIQSDGVVAKLLCILGSFSREVFFQMGDALLIRDIFVMIANLCLCGRSIDRLRKLVRFLQSFR